MSDSNLAGQPALNYIPQALQSAADYETQAQHHLPPTHYAHISGGAGSEQSLRANTAAFSELSLLPQLLVDCSQGHTRVESNLPCMQALHPIWLAPVAAQQLAHPDGELATAEAAEALNAKLLVSTLSNYSLEDIAQSSQEAKWFQLYLQSEWQVTLDLAERAAQAGYEALVITLDTPIQSLSRRAAAAGFSMPAQLHYGSLVNYPAPKPMVLSNDVEASHVFQGFMKAAPSWQQIEELIKLSSLPVFIKGVLNPVDAQRLLAIGASGLIVSNHGGRALDCAPATLSVLPKIRQAVGEGIPIILDGGIRSGSDVVKALVLGADAILLGRPYLYALSVAGALGVAHLLKLLREELETTMALLGCPTIAALKQCQVQNLSKI